jgi:hypothetical protein
VPAQSGKTHDRKYRLGRISQGYSWNSSTWKGMSELTDGVAVNVKLVEVCSTQSFKVHPKLFVLGAGCGIDDCR